MAFLLRKTIPETRSRDWEGTLLTPWGAEDVKCSGAAVKNLVGGTTPLIPPSICTQGDFVDFISIAVVLKC